MIAKNNYVWFLPVWITKENILNASLTTIYNDNNCKPEELEEALNGHFSLSHAPFGNETSLMQENISVEDWRTNYLKILNYSKIPIFDYGAYAYDVSKTIIFIILIH